MLLSFRRTAIAELGASVATRAFVHTRYRVHVIDNRNVVCDDELFLPAIARVGRVSRPVLTLILAGRARIRLSGGFERWLEPGDVALLPTKAAVAMRQEGDSFRSVAVEWDAGTFGGSVARGVECARLDAATMARAVAVVRGLESCSDGLRASLRLAELVAILRSFGVAFDRVAAGDLIEAAGEPVVRLARALDLVLSRLESAPALVDLDGVLQLSPRQINRVVARFNERYGFNASGWRDTRNRRRLLVGATMMTAEGAKTEQVARAMGYASPTSFCHAFDEAGLPSPGATAAVVSRLR